jgi:hypothetical protein
MPRKKGKRKNRGSSGAMTSQGENLGDNVVSFTGPIISRTARAQNTRCTALLAYTIDLTATAGGVIANVLGVQNPASCTNWSSFANCFDEYRVLGSVVKYTPRNKYTNTVAIATFIPGFIVLDRDSVAALTTFSGAVGYESCKEIELDQKWSISYKMASLLEAVWITTATPVNRGAFLIYFSGLLNNASYGKIIQYFLVQFRGCT